MTSTLFKIVFEGQLRNGVELQTAKLNLAQLFNSEVAAVEKLFNGHPVALKRGLSQTDARVYLNALNDAGVDARIEADPAISLNMAEVEEVSPPAPAFQAEPVSPYAPPRANVINAATGHAELKVFSFQGRIGRVRYLAWTFVLMVSMSLALGICATAMSYSLVGGGLLMAVVGAAAGLVGLQIGAQRLHDAGWSGWLLLLHLVPYVGFILPLVLVLAPGNKSANRYGPPPVPNSKPVKVMACLWIFLIVLFVIVGLAGGLATLHEEIEATTAEYEQSLPYDDAQPGTSDDSAQPEGEDDQ